MRQEEDEAMAKGKTHWRKWISPAKNSLQMKITLRYVSPPIWRRVVVPDNITLGDLYNRGFGSWQ